MKNETNVVKSKNVKYFFNELKDMGFNVCNCKNCRSYRRDLVNISYKIANQLDAPDGFTEKDHCEVIDSFAVDIGCSILNTQYLIDLGKYEDVTGNLIDCDDSDQMMFIHDLICYSDSLMNTSERKHFGHNIEFIVHMFDCDECWQHYADTNCLSQIQCPPDNTATIPV